MTEPHAVRRPAGQADERVLEFLAPPRTDPTTLHHYVRALKAARPAKKAAA